MKASPSSSTSTYNYKSVFAPEMISDLQTQPHLSIQDGQRHIEFTIHARENILENHRIRRQVQLTATSSMDQQHEKQQLDSSCLADSDSDLDTGYLEKELGNIFQYTRMIIQRVAQCNNGFEIPYPHPPGSVRMRAIIGSTAIGVIPAATTAAGGGVVVKAGVKSESEERSVTKTITDQPPLYSSPPPSCSLSLSTSITTSRSLIPQINIVQPPDTTVVTSTTITAATTTTGTTTTTNTKLNAETKTSTLCCNTNEPPVKPNSVRKPTIIKKPTTSKPASSFQRNPSQESYSPSSLQTSTDKFVVSSKPSISTSPIPDLKGVSAKSSTSSSGSSIAPVLIEPIITSPTTPTTPITPMKPKPKAKLTITPPRSPSPVKKLDNLSLNSTTIIPPSPPRLKPNVFFRLLPPPTVSTTHKTTSTSSSEPTTANETEIVSKPKTAASYSSVASGVAAPRIIKIKNSLADAKVLSAVATNVKSNSAAATTSTAIIAMTAQPTRIIKMKSSTPPELKQATPKRGSERTTAAATAAPPPPPPPTTTGAVPHIRVAKIGSSSLESKVGPIFTAAVAAVSKAVSNATASSESGKSASKASKAPPSTTTATTSSKTKNVKLLTSRAITVASTKSNTKLPSDDNATNTTTTISRTKKKTFGEATVVVASKSPSGDKAVKFNTSKMIFSKDGITTATAASKPSKALSISTTPKDKYTPSTTKAMLQTRPARKSNPSATETTTTAPGTPPSPISPSWHTTTTTSTTSHNHRHRRSTSPTTPFSTTSTILLDDISMTSPGSTVLISPPPARSFSFRTSPSGIMHCLSTEQLKNRRKQQQHQHQLADTAASATTANDNNNHPSQVSQPPQKPPPPPPPPQQQQQQQQQKQQQHQLHSSPRPKRLLELILQEDRENNTINDHSSTSSHHSRSPYDSDEHSPFLEHGARPRKRPRLMDLPNTTNINANLVTARIRVSARVATAADRKHGMFGQTAFEQALDAMSFKYPTAITNTATPTTAVTTATAMSASRRLYHFQQRRMASVTNNGRVLRGVGDAGSSKVARWIP
ncbi:MAG: hypothetical protein J3R72DRAFT_515425 [Linnemannia gamsii]|nr:MAG: hypothetical protein J3R72DRAFT_515425 [Linnemannia gamsii]